MSTAIQKVYKAEIEQNLFQAKKQIDGLILEINNTSDWKKLHEYIARAATSLRTAVRLLAEQHVAICVLEKYRHGNTKFQTQDINEITKVYRYLE